MKAVNILILLKAVLAISLFMPAFLMAEDAKMGVHMNPEKVVGADQCAMCHRNEFQVWQKTPHYQTYEEMHRRPRAKEIADKMGIKGSIKRRGMCRQCHYTVQGKREKVISGISCESCHGPAQDWINIHNNAFMPKEERNQKVDAAGMVRPARIYNVGENCYQCHTIPNEKLVNVGGHPHTSEGFNLLTWSQGMIRHNFLRGRGKNMPPTKEYKRVLFVVGSSLKLEYHLRGFAKATKKAKYAIEMANKMKEAARELNKIAKATGIQEIKDMLATLKRVWKIRLGNEEAFLKSADEIKALSEKFVEKYGGAGGSGGADPVLAKLDDMIPKNSEFKGQPIGE